MSLKPFIGYILVEQIDDTQTTTSGLALPETAKDKPVKGKVLDFSPIVPREARDFCILEEPDKLTPSWKSELLRIKIGSTIVFKKWGGQDITEDGKDLKFVRFDEVMGVYED